MSNLLKSMLVGLTLIATVWAGHAFFYSEFATVAALAGVERKVDEERLWRELEDLKQTIRIYQREFGVRPLESQNMSREEKILYQELVEDRNETKKELGIGD